MMRHFIWIFTVFKSTRLGLCVCVHACMHVCLCVCVLTVFINILALAIILFKKKITSKTCKSRVALSIQWTNEYTWALTYFFVIVTSTTKYDFLEKILPYVVD